jgi:hypothetical protein
MYPVEKIKENVKVGVDSVEKMIKEKPGIALTGAFIIGGLTVGGIALLLRGRNSVSHREQ